MACSLVKNLVTMIQRFLGSLGVPSGPELSLRGPEEVPRGHERQGQPQVGDRRWRRREGVRPPAGYPRAVSPPMPPGFRMAFVFSVVGRASFTFAHPQEDAPERRGRAPWGLCTVHGVAFIIKGRLCGHMVVIPCPASVPS